MCAFERSEKGMEFLMKRKVMIALYIILILAAIKLIYNQLLNTFLINDYNNNKYNEDYAKALTYINFPQKYIAHYNYGNVLYKKGEYEEAIEKYEKALKGIIPKNKECNIRINYALAICKTVEVDESDSKSIKDAIQTYEKAIEALTEKGCANKDNDNGHNKKSEQLKKDIQKEIERLKKLENSSSDSTAEEKEEGKEINETETIESKMQDIKENALQDQREVESKYKNYGNFDYNKVEKNW